MGVFQERVILGRNLFDYFPQNCLMTSLWQVNFWLSRLNLVLSKSWAVRNSTWLFLVFCNKFAWYPKGHAGWFNLSNTHSLNSTQEASATIDKRWSSFLLRALRHPLFLLTLCVLGSHVYHTNSNVVLQTTPNFSAWHHCCSFKRIFFLGSPQSPLHSVELFFLFSAHQVSPSHCVPPPLLSGGSLALLCSALIGLFIQAKRPLLLAVH